MNSAQVTSNISVPNLSTVSFFFHVYFYIYIGDLQRVSFTISFAQDLSTRSPHTTSKEEIACIYRVKTSHNECSTSVGRASLVGGEE